MCIKIDPIKVCGNHGSCSTNFTCICERGWTQSLDFAVYIDDESLVDTLPCDTFDPLITAFYVASAILNSVGIIFYMNVMKTKKKIKRLTPNVLFLLILLVVAIIKLEDYNGTPFGYNFPLTALVAISFFWSDMSALVYCQEYMRYLLKKYPVIEGIVGSVELLLLPRFAFQSSISMALLRAWGVHSMINGLLLVFFSWYLMGILYKDIQFMVTPDKYVVGLDDNLKIELRRHLPKIKRAQLSIVFATAWKLIPYSQTAFWTQYSTVGWKYVLPVFHILWALIAIQQVYIQMRHRMNQRKKFASVVEYDDLLL